VLLRTQLENVQVIQVKTAAMNGYDALQIGAGDAPNRSFNKPELGHFSKAGVEPKRIIKEFRVTPDAVLQPGKGCLALSCRLDCIQRKLDTFPSQARSFPSTILSQGSCSLLLERGMPRLYLVTRCIFTVCCGV
jgi:hypothetical protein